MPCSLELAAVPNVDYEDLIYYGVMNCTWLQAVRAVIWEWRIGFAGIAFQFDCLWLDVLYEDIAKPRVQRVIKLWFGNESIL